MDRNPPHPTRDVNRWLPGLERVRAALDRLGHPERTYPHVLIGGTNGKGSTCVYLERILLAKGLRVGTTLSPHVSTYGERFRIDGRDVRDTELRDVELELEPRLGDLDLTYFEWTVVLACELFARCQVDYGLFEIGLGGRLDAANALDPCLSIITNIALDHMDYLGETTTDIAREKAAIARPGKILLTAADEGLETIAGYAAQIGSRLMVRHDALPLATGIPGPHQGRNAALAIAAAEILSPPVTPTELRWALGTAFLPGRIETLGRVILDVAHNPAAMTGLAGHLAAVGFRGTGVLGVLGDKDYLQIARILKPICAEIFIAPVNSQRSWDAQAMDAVMALGGIRRFPSITAALNRALQTDRNVVVTGSFHTVGEVRNTILCQGP